MTAAPIDVEKWLLPCPACDAGLTMSCTCPSEDPRIIINALAIRNDVLQDRLDQLADEHQMVRLACEAWDGYGPLKERNQQLEAANARLRNELTQLRRGQLVDD